MSPRRAVAATVLAAALGLTGCAPAESGRTPRKTLVMGIDVSGSFRRHYDDAIEFTALYLYGHLNGLGGLRVPTAVFLRRLLPHVKPLEHQDHVSQLRVE